MPIIRRHLANLAGLTALVRKSAAISSVLQYSNLTSPLRTLSKVVHHIYMFRPLRGHGVLQ
jgi:hypothetical protein